MILKNKQIIHGYGASTGKCFITVFGIDNKKIKFISDRNPKKNNLYTPGTNIKIVNEKISRSKEPDYYLVLPWKFKNEILKREKTFLKKKTKFIFPLPNITVSTI